MQNYETATAFFYSNHSSEKVAHLLTRHQKKNIAKAHKGRREGRKRQARKHPSTTVYYCSQLIAPQAAGCWHCLSGPSPKGGYRGEEGRAGR